MQSRASRVARGWMAGSFATGVAALGHGLVDGAAPSAFAIVNALVFAGLLGTLLTGKRPSLPRLAVTVVGAQFGFHLVFSWLTPGTTTAAAPASGAPGHHATAELLAPAVAHHGTDPLMWVAHTLAAVATLVFLARAERALWSLLAEALDAVTVARTPVLAPRPARSANVPREAGWHPLPLVFLTVLSHRGPPALVGA